ncbi:hypothetical protein F5877DRAFT_73402, partial [Lentinula edodes]
MAWLYNYNALEQTERNRTNCPIHQIDPERNCRRSKRVLGDPEPQSPDSFDPLLDSQSRQKDPSLKKVLTSLRQVARRPSSEHINKLLIDLGLQKILLNAGLLSYLLFTFRLLWKLSMRFRSQPRSVGVSFVVPSVAMYAFVQRHTMKEVNETDMGILQAAVD